MLTLSLTDYWKFNLYINMALTFLEYCKRLADLQISHVSETERPGNEHFRIVEPRIHQRFCLAI